MELNEIDGGQNISEEPLTSGRRAFSNRKIILAIASIGLGKYFSSRNQFLNYFFKLFNIIQKSLPEFQ